MKFQSLEAFRGIAAIMVVLYHSPFYSETSHVSIVRNSPLFVDFFFVLSGFVMTFAYQGKIGNTVHFRQFFLLRFGRIYPLHLCMLLLWVLYVVVKYYLYSHGYGGTNPIEHNNLYSFITNVLLVQSLGFHKQLTWNYPSWSICLEFAAYMIFFVYVYYLSKTINIFVMILIPVTSYVLLYLFGSEILATYDLGILRCIGGFFAGVLVYTSYEAFPFSIKSKKYATITEILSICVLIYVVSNADGGESVYFVFLSILSFMSVVYLYSIQNIGIVSRLLNGSISQFVGKLSYSIYMTHAIILAVVLNLMQHIYKRPLVSFEGADKAMVFGWANYLNTILVLIVILFSVVTYTYIEMPWRERFRTFVKKDAPSKI